MKRIDINADVGEGSGNSVSGTDMELMKYISSVNIACGYHAGCALLMNETVKSALKNNISIGAHPSYPDIENFGRKSMTLADEELEAIILYQVGALKTMVEAQGGKLHHVKPHGALYNDMAKDRHTATIVAKAIKKVDAKLILVGMANSVTIEVAKTVGLHSIEEVFADRTYLDSGLLVPRSHKNAVLHKAEEGIAQVKNMVTNGYLTSICGKQININADTICVHGDNPEAVNFAKLLHDELNTMNVDIKAAGKW